MGAELFVPPRRTDEDESIGAFMTRRFGAEATTYLAEPLLAGIHAGDVNRLSVRALFPRFTEAERTYGSLLRAFRRQPSRAIRGRRVSLAPWRLERTRTALVAALPAESIRMRTPVGAHLFDSASRHDSHRRRRTAERARGRACNAGLCDLAYCRRHGPRAREILQRGALRFDGHDRARLSARGRRTSAQRIRVRRPARRAHGIARGVVALVEMGGSCAGRSRPAPRLRRRRARSRSARAARTTSSSRGSLAALRPLLGMTGEPLLARVYRWDARQRAARGRHLARLEDIDRAVRQHPGALRHRQRISRRRHS